MMPEHAASKHDALAWCLRLTAAIGLGGLAIISIAGYGPWLDLFWRQAWVEPIIENLFGMSWMAYVQNTQITRALGWVGRGIGGIYALAALLCLVMRPRWLTLAIVSLATMFIATEAVLSYFDRGARFFQGMEFALQASAPLLAVLAVAFAWRGRFIQAIMAGAIAMTFLAHGLWALDVHVNLGLIDLFYPTPGRWIDMTLALLPVTRETHARLILKIVGVIDLAAAAAVLVPLSRSVALTWMIAWGLLTTVARVAVNLDAPLLTVDSLYWLGETLRRVPHAGVPLALWLLHRQGKKVPARQSSPATTGSLNSSA